MKESNVVTLRVPGEMKERLERLAGQQGVSMNHLATYLLNRDITQMEMSLALERRACRAPVASLQKKARSVLDKVPARPVPAWDKLG